MSDHLNQKQIDNYGRYTLPAAEWLFVVDHLSVCESCRLRVEEVISPEAAYRALRAETFGSAEASVSAFKHQHLTFEQMAGLIDGIVADEEVRAIHEHLTWCKECEEAVDDLRGFKDEAVAGLEPINSPGTPAVPLELAPERRWQRILSAIRVKTPTLVFASALLLLLLGLIGRLLFWPESRTNPDVAVASPTPNIAPSLTPSNTPNSAAADDIVRLNDGDEEVSLDRQGNLSGLDHLPPEHRDLARRALGDQKIGRSPLLAGLSPMKTTPRGISEYQHPEFSVIEPDGVVTLNDYPTFRWAPLRTATDYVVEVYDEQFNMVAVSPHVAAPAWTATAPLNRGEVYFWLVKAFGTGKEFSAARPPTRQAKFRILDDADARKLAQARRTNPSSHLVMGLLYLQSGVLREAEQEFRALVKANPHSPLARRLLRQSQMR